MGFSYIVTSVSLLIIKGLGFFWYFFTAVSSMDQDTIMQNVVQTENRKHRVYYPII